MMSHPQSLVLREGVGLMLCMLTIHVLFVGGSRCKTCKHLVVGNSFASNVTGKSYNISCPRGSISCGTKNVIYVISCKKCGVQYVGETSQTLRGRFNNHI